MLNADGSAVAGIDRPPWDAPNTMYFSGGWFSSFASAAATCSAWR